MKREQRTEMGLAAWVEGREERLGLRENEENKNKIKRR